LPADTTLISRGETSRVLLSKDNDGLVSYGVFGYENPHTGQFSPANNTLTQSADGTVTQVANPFRLSMPGQADGWFQFGPDRDTSSGAVKARLVGANPSPVSFPSPSQALYVDAFDADGPVGAATDIVAGYDGRGSYSDYLVIRTPAAFLRYDFELSIPSGVTISRDAIGGLNFDQADGTRLRVQNQVSSLEPADVGNVFIRWLHVFEREGACEGSAVLPRDVLLEG
jgi:hypothetical protein